MPQLIVCHWIVTHNVTDAATAEAITREEITVLREAERTLKTSLETARLLRDTGGQLSNLNLYTQVVPLMWLEAQREWGEGNQDDALKALAIAANLAEQHRRLSQVRIDAGVILSADTEHIRISLAELEFQKSVRRLQQCLESRDSSGDAEQTLP